MAAEDEAGTSIPIDDMYYTLEYNLEAMEGYETMRVCQLLSALRAFGTQVRSLNRQKPLKKPRWL